MNAAGQSERPSGLPGRGAGAELHPGRRHAGCLAVGAQPHHPRARGAAGGEASRPHDAERLADGGRPAPDAHRGTAIRGDRGGAPGPGRASREARGHDPHHRHRPCGRHGSLAEACEAPAGVSGHQGRDRRRLWPDRHRGTALRCRRARRRAGGEGHDRRAHRAGHAHGGRGGPVLSRRAAGATDAAGADRPRLHQSSPARPMAGSMPGSSRRAATS